MGYKILSEERVGEDDRYYEVMMGPDFYDKRYNNQKDAFYIAVIESENNNVNTFNIKITKSYNKTFYTLFPSGKFPELLPEPLQIENMIIIDYHFGGTGGSGPSNPGVYSNNSNCSFYWLNSNKTRMISLDGIEGSVVGITIANWVLPSFIDEHIE